MRKVVAQSVMVALLTACLGSQSLAQHWSKKAYEASYELQSNVGKNSLRMVTDGEGRTRNEIVTPMSKMVSIIDAPNKVMYSIIEANHTIMKMPYQESTVGVTDEQSAKAANAKPLGAKVIDGHPCHGWQIVKNDATTESWTGDDIGCVVMSTTKSPSSNSSMHLLKYSASKPNASEFVPPSGYKVMDMPNGAAVR